MKVLVTKLKQIFQKYSKGIFAVLALDILEIALLSLNPLVIGLCIDSFFGQNYLWLCVLIILQVSFIVVCTVSVNHSSVLRVAEKSEKIQ